LDPNNKLFRNSNQKTPPARRGMKNAGFIAILILIGLVIFAAYAQPSTLKEIPITQAAQDANAGKYSSISVNGNEVDITKKGDSQPTLKAYTEPNATLKDEGFNYSKVQISAKAASGGTPAWLALLEYLGPVVLIGLIFYFMLRSAQGQGNQALSFGKSKARLYGNEKDRINFKDIAGYEESKQDLEEVVEFLRFPKKFEAVGAKIPKGVLLIGPPGTGKTMIARAVAGEANVPFFSISGSEFVEMFVGVGASRVRDLFAKAKKNSPCIIFIDEIDAVGRRRGSGMGGGHDEREQTLNQILRLYRDAIGRIILGHNIHDLVGAFQLQMANQEHNVVYISTLPLTGIDAGSHALHCQQIPRSWHGQ